MSLRLVPWLSLGLMLPASLQLPTTSICRGTARLIDLSHITGTAKQKVSILSIFLYTWDLL